MSGDVLSQAEVESLLSAMEGRERAASSPALRPPGSIARPGAKISPYDFKRPERVGKEQMRALQTMHEASAAISARRFRPCCGRSSR